MEKSILTYVCVAAVLVTQVWSLSIKTEKRSLSKKSNKDTDAGKSYDMDDLRRSYAMLLDYSRSLANNDDHPFGFAKRDHPFGFQKRDHPFGFGLSRSSAFHGRKREYAGNDFPGIRSSAFHGKRSSADAEEQNTSVFHGKRNVNGEMPSRSSVFHGKRDMMDYLENDIESEKRKI